MDENRIWAGGLNITVHELQYSTELSSLEVENQNRYAFSLLIAGNSRLHIQQVPLT